MVNTRCGDYIRIGYSQMNILSVVTHRVLDVFQERIKVDNGSWLYLLRSVSLKLTNVACLFSSFAERAANFSKRRDSLRVDREITINNIVLNPAHAVYKASLTTTPASLGDDTTTTLSIDVLAEVSLVQSKKSDKTKGKKLPLWLRRPRGLMRNRSRRS